MPALNEQENVADAVRSTLESFRRHGIDGEVIVINDGSTDHTRDVVAQIMSTHSNVRIINHEKPHGIGKSFLDGVWHSEMDVVVLLPGDNEISADETLSFFRLMKQVDIIVPFVHNVEIREFSRQLTSSAFKFIINRTFGLNLNYTNGAVFYRRVLLTSTKIQSFGFFFQAELLVRLIRKGYLFAEVPTFLSLRKAGRSTAISIPSFLDVAFCFVRLFWDMYRPGTTHQRDKNSLHPATVSARKYALMMESAAE